MPQTTTPLCNHTHPDGRRCGSFALRGELFCYHHHPGRPLARGPRHAAGRAPFILPVVFDRRSLQIALAEVALRIADNTLDTKRAGILMQCLQVAATTHST